MRMTPGRSSFFHDLPPSRQIDVESRFAFRARVHGVENRIAVLEQQLAPDDGNLHMRHRRAALSVE